jgi:protein TonB
MKVLKLALIILIAISCSTFSQEEIDKMPTIKGGIQALTKNIKYPESAKKDGIMGTVFVKALIDENGNVENAEVEKGVNEDLNAAAVSAVKDTKFTPGENDGKKVKAEVTIPIKFKLDDCQEVN